MEEFETNVFINCPFDDEYAPLLEVILFCVVYFGLHPRLSSESLEAGQSRLEKILILIGNSKYSIHDLSRCKSKTPNEYARMNMPFELGIDLGIRRSKDKDTDGKSFLIFEHTQYETKMALSDIAGQDIQFHNGDYDTLIGKVRDFFRVEAGAEVVKVGADKIKRDYEDFLGWLDLKKKSEGHSQTDRKNLPTLERLEEMTIWVDLGKPVDFEP